MQLSTPTAMREIYAMNYLSDLLEKPPFSRNAPIHSTKVRQHIYKGATSYGKLHTGFLRDGNKGTTSQNTMQLQSFKAQFPNKKKQSLRINDQQALERDFQDFFDNHPEARPKTTANIQRPVSHLTRVPTSQSQTRNTHTGNFFMMNTTKSFTKGLLSPDDITRRGLMVSTENIDGREFTDDYVQEKYQNIIFAHASSVQEPLKLIKLSNFDVTLVPNDSRRVVIEALMRDYFLNLIPENSDFLICKNSLTHFYSIIFTGRLVPSCKVCSSLAQLEVSKDLGFRVICTADFCHLKVLYTNNLSDYTIDSLWPQGSRINVEPSVQFDEARKMPILSKLVQSGRFKRVDFSQVLTETSITPGTQPYMRPNTTANIMRTHPSMPKITKIRIKTSLETEPIINEVVRPNTVQGLVHQRNSRPGTSGNIEQKGFFQGSLTKEFDDRRIFSREKMKKKSVDEIIEEKVADEDQGGQSVKGRSLERKIQKVASVGALGKQSKASKGKSNQELKLEEYSIKGEKKMIYGTLSRTDRTDNSLDDIHNMVSLITSQENKTSNHS